MRLTDTHCHIQDESYADSVEALDRARSAGVERVICASVDAHTSRQAVEFAESHDGVYAMIALHPHDAARGLGEVRELDILESPKIIGVGECGLDYFYQRSPRDIQIDVLHAQIELAQRRHLPIDFHVRDAFADFWSVFDQYQGLKGVVHSFTGSRTELDQALSRGLMIGVNGIATFTRDTAQIEMFDAIPIDRLVLETDAPYLTPVPHRGKINEPAHIRLVAQHLADRRGVSLQELAAATEANVLRVFDGLSE